MPSLSKVAIVTPVNCGIVSFPSSSRFKKQSVSLTHDVLIAKKNKSLIVRATSEDHGPRVSNLGKFWRRVRNASANLEEVQELRTKIEKDTVEVFGDDDLTNVYGSILMQEQELIRGTNLGNLGLKQAGEDSSW